MTVFGGDDRACPQCGFDWVARRPGGARGRRQRLRPLFDRLREGEGARYGAAGTWSPRGDLLARRRRPAPSSENLWMLALDPDAGFTPWRGHDVMSARSPSPMSVRVGCGPSPSPRATDRAATRRPPDVSAWHPTWVGEPRHVLRWSAHEVVHHRWTCAGPHLTHLFIDPINPAADHRFGVFRESLIARCLEPREDTEGVGARLSQW